jgi:hypothetical protein
VASRQVRKEDRVAQYRGWTARLLDRSGTGWSSRRVSWFREIDVFRPEYGLSHVHWQTIPEAPEMALSKMEMGRQALSWTLSTAVRSQDSHGS